MLIRILFFLRKFVADMIALFLPMMRRLNIIMIFIINNLMI